MQFKRGFNHRRFGGIDHQRAIYAAGEAADHLAHFRHFIAPDKGGADIKAVRSLGHLLTAHGNTAIPIARRLAFAPSLGSIGIAALTNREIGILLTQRRCGVERRN